MSHIIVVGAGALGSHVVLAARNVGPITVIDFDRIEMKNVQAQFHGKMNVGQNKAVSLARIMQQVFGVKVEARSAQLREDNAEALLTGDNFIVDCTDNLAARTLIREFTLAKNIPCIHACLAGDTEYARVVWSKGFTPDREDTGQATCEDSGHLPFYVMVSSVVVSIIRAYLDQGTVQNCSVTPKSLFWF